MNTQTHTRTHIYIIKKNFKEKKTNILVLIYPHKTNLPHHVDELNQVEHTIESTYEMETANNLAF